MDTDYELFPSSRRIDTKELRSEEIERISSAYQVEIAQRTSGPQQEGIESGSLKEALLTDPDVQLIEIQDGNGEKVQWPLLVPVEHQIDYNLDFFEKRYLAEGREVYYLSLPPLDQIDTVLDSNEIVEIARKIKEKRALIAFDFLDEGENGEIIQSFVESMFDRVSSYVDDITPISTFGKGEKKISFGLPKVDHFEITAIPQPSQEIACPDLNSAVESIIEDGSIERDPETGVCILSRDLLLQNDHKYLKQVISIYNEQFSRLTEDHPSLQKSPEEELKEMLLDESNVNIGYVENGEVVGLVYFIQNIKNAVWLNDRFYNKDEDEVLIYFPGIVVRQDKASQGLQYMPEMLEVVRTIFKRVDKKIRILFQCTNISRAYIPDMVISVGAQGEGSKILRYADGQQYKKVAEYDYRILEIE